MSHSRYNKDYVPEETLKGLLSPHQLFAVSLGVLGSWSLSAFTQSLDHILKGNGNRGQLISHRHPVHPHTCCVGAPWGVDMPYGRQL